MPKVFILAEKRDEGLHPISFELIGAGRKLVRDQGGQIEVALLGDEMGSLAQELLATGVTAVHTVESPLLAEYTNDGYVDVLSRLVESISPGIVLVGQTSMGRDLAPRLAFRLDGAVAMDCIDLQMDADIGTLTVTRPIFGGSILATYEFGKDTAPQIVTIRSKAFEMAEPVNEPAGEIKPFSPDLDASQIRTKTLERISLLKEGEARLEDAAIIVSGGWGLGGKENYQIIEDLARAIGGAPGASRPICDLEWTEHSRHIGLTGKMVAPELYIAVAISGAMHHIAGCADSKVIVGINTDAKASIFRYAKYGIVGDYAEIVPALIRQLENSPRE
jgi:electron transfer flavoprotein alpha subunit